VSGAKAERPELKKMMEYIREGDTLVVSSLDRLGRNAADLLRIVDTLAEKSVELESLKEKLDTTSPTGKFMLQIFAAVAELERASIRERQREGLELAKKRGVKLGRPTAPLPEGFESVSAEVKAGKLTKYRAAKQLRMPYQTLGDAFKRISDKIS
jgi:DNA invertase Pin-like site-specific DNA recombinase